METSLQSIKTYLENGLVDCSTSFLSYIVLLGATTLHTYIEVVHVWMFPSISSWVIAGAFGSMLLHCDWRISCSCRNRLLWNRYPKHSNLHIFYPLQYADFQNLFPIAQHSFLEIMKGNMFSFLDLKCYCCTTHLLKRQKRLKNMRTMQI